MTETSAFSRLAYRKLVAPPMTWLQRAFDVFFGLAVPVNCFDFDPILFQGGISGPPSALEFRARVYAFAAVQLVTLSLWLAFGPRLGRRLAGICAGVLLAGAAFTVALLLAISLSGHGNWLFGVVFALPAWLVLFPYLRNAARAFSFASRETAGIARLGLPVAGALFACVVVPFVGNRFDPLIPGRLLTDALQASHETGRPLVLADVVPVPWEAVYIFGPYQTPTGIDAALGFEWDGPEKTWLNGGTGYDLLAFISGTRVVRYAVLWRAPPTFCDAALNRRIARDAARFKNGCL